MISKGFYEQLETIAAERHIEISDVLSAVRTALIKACQLEGCKGEIEVEFNDEQKIFVFSKLFMLWMKSILRDLKVK